MTISSRIRRATVFGAAALTLSFGGLAAAVPAHAQTATPTISYDPDYVAICDPIWDINTTPGVEAFALPAGCMQITQPSSLTVNTGSGISMKLVVQGDGNFVLYVSTGKVWAANTRPGGYAATFQGDGNLVVRNSSGTALWASNTHTYPHAILAFQTDGNLVIYPSTTDFHALWASGTN